MDCFITDYCLERRPGAQSAILEDSIMHKGRPVAAGSKVFGNFISPLDATVVTRLESAGVTILGKAKMDEFGLSGLFAGSNAEVPGAVSAVAGGIADFALCNDYSGAVRQNASERGVCYIHPTYGTVSRFGLIPAAPSMDQIGVVCKTPADGFRVLSIIAGNDPNDGAMFPDDGQGRVKSEKLKVESERGADKMGIGGDRRLRVGVPDNVSALVRDDSYVDEFAKAFEIVCFDLKYFKVYAQVMQILCCAEISSNITRYDGIKFGFRAEGYRDLRELYTRSRTEALGFDAKLAAIVGAMVVSQGKYEMYYDKAMRLRRLIMESLKFDKYDVILMPVPDAGSASALAFHALPQLCGLPAATVPFSGGGITLIAAAKQENTLYEALEAVGV
ncbi:MAG: hypothetical protein LBH28_02065 [Oscillospiraceae bacterium]|nr:hypothetical protein [Oscillospiraceae bacterium]